MGKQAAEVHIMMSGGPCFQCTDRELGCHATCEKYIEFAEECERVRKNRQDHLKNTYRGNDMTHKQWEGRRKTGVMVWKQHKR